MSESGTGTDEEDGGRRHGRRRLLRWTALGTCGLVLAGAAVGWSLYRDLDGNIRTDVGTARELARHARERPATAPGEARNILLLGSDSRDGGNARYGHAGGRRSDTTILLHLAADGSSATAVSLPRDLMVEIPRCRRPDGGHSRARLAQFNWAFQFGGAACTIRTVERLTGVRVDHHLVVDFQGFTRIVDAVGGVEVCLPHAVHDRDAHLDLPAGRRTLGGDDALGYVRARKSFDGSDTQRMERQQRFLASLVRKVHDKGVLLDPTKLYPVLDAATSALTADAGLDSLTELYELVRGLREIPEDRVKFLTVPRRPYPADPNRDELAQPAAEQLFRSLRGDRAVRVKHRSAGTAPSPDTAPSRDSTYRGTTAARDVCAQDGAGIGGN